MSNKVSLYRLRERLPDIVDAKTLASKLRTACSSTPSGHVPHATLEVQVRVEDKEDRELLRHFSRRTIAAEIRRALGALLQSENVEVPLSEMGKVLVLKGMWFTVNYRP